MTSRLLVIAGSDSSAGAGIAADLKTAQAFGVYAQVAVTAVTAQDTAKVHAVHPLPAALVQAQIAATLGDIGADAVKIGMLANGAIAAAVVEALAGHDLPLVLDPVLLSSSGTVLLDAEGAAILTSRLLPRALLVTPNLLETEALVGLLPQSEADLREAGARFGALGVPHVLFKGGHGVGEMVDDVLANTATGALVHFVSPRQTTKHTHGTGCTLATAIACGLAQNLMLAEAVSRAHRFVQDAIRTAPGLGAGSGPLNHATRVD